MFESVCVFDAAIGQYQQGDYEQGNDQFANKLQDEMHKTENDTIE